MNTEPTYEQLKAKLAEYEAALDRERKPDWEKWLNELAAWLDDIAGSYPFQSQDHDKMTEAARQLRYMATSFTLKANFVRYNLAIQKWWWWAGHSGSPDLANDMESFMREHNIPLERPT